MDMMKIHLQILLLSFVLSTLLSGTLQAQSESGIRSDLPVDVDLTPVAGHPPDMETLASVRERFLFDVRFGFLDLGDVEVTITPDSSYDGNRSVHIRTVMTTNHRLLFVGRREVHYQSFSGYTSDWPFSYVFWRDDVHDEEYESSKIIFDRESGFARFFEEGEETEEVPLEEPASGGDIIFLFSRMFAGTDSTYSMPVYIDDEVGSVRADNSAAVEMRSYDAFPEPVETYYSEGYADIDGPFGFTGNFKAWFATDSLRIPVEAHARIIFGNVRLLLKEYERYE